MDLPAGGLNCTFVSHVLCLIPAELSLKEMRTLQHNTSRRLQADLNLSSVRENKHEGTIWHVDRF